MVRYTESSGSCTQETIILDNLPASTNHNGGIIQFGPDGKLYVIIGDAENTANSQNVTSLAGKVLRVNPDGSAPSDNPFISNANANAKKVYSLGHRNSYGLRSIRTLPTSGKLKTARRTMTRSIVSFQAAITDGRL